MFSDHSTEATGFSSSWRKEKSLKTSNVQTDPISSKESSSQIPSKVETEVQTDVVQKIEIAPVDYDAYSLAAFLRKVSPGICKALEKNACSHAFDRCQLETGIENISTELMHTLTYKQLYPEFQCSDISWNSTDSVLAVAYGAESHEDWCEHDSSVAIWNLNRKDFSSQKANTIIETDCCISVIAFHPEFPAVLLGGKFNGEILLWNIGQDDDMLLASTGSIVDGHRETITCLHWIDVKGESKYKFVSSSLDGKILIWRFNERKQIMQIMDGFIILADQLPRSLGIKSNFQDAEVGVTSLSFNCEDPSIFVIGTEGGGVFQCSLNSETPAHYSLASSSLMLKSPLVMSFSHHQGHVTSLCCSPHIRNVFLSCGTDGELRVYSLFQPQPVLTFQSINGFRKAQWSDVRPLLFAAVSISGELFMYDLNVSRSMHIASFIIQDKCSGSALEFGKSNKLLATGVGNGNIQIWQLSSSCTVAGPKEKDILNEIASVALET